MKVTTNEKLMITTSRKPSQITRRFSQFLKHYFNAIYINRGKLSVNKVMINAIKEDATKLLIIHETKGNPSKIDVYSVSNDLNQELITSVYISVSLPTNKNKISVNSNEIKIVPLTKKLNNILKLFSFKRANHKDEKINCIIIKEDDDDNNIASINFIDKLGKDTKYRIYVKGFDILNQDE